MLAWFIWYSRNKKIFENRTLDPWATVLSASSTYQDYQAVMMLSIQDPIFHFDQVRIWKPPDTNFVKLNIYLTLFEDGSAGSGAIFRDHVGQVPMAASCRHQAVNSPPECETQAIISAL